MRVWISSYKNPGVLKLCVQSWLRYTSFPITVFDDYSTAECRSTALSLASDRVAVLAPENRVGHAAAMQRAIEAEEDYVLFSDADIEVLEPITEQMFPDAELSGVYLGYFVDAVVAGCYTLPRFHTSFLRCRRALLKTISLDQRFLLAGDLRFRYDSGAVLYWTLKNAGRPIAEIPADLERRFIHYFGQSTLENYATHPTEVQAHNVRVGEIIRMRLDGHEVDPRPLKAEFDRLWRKYTRVWNINVLPAAELSAD